jgi:cytochrome c oxidase subunit 2
MIQVCLKLACLAAFLLAAGCSGVQSALNPTGPVAGELAWLIWFFTGLCAAVWVLVMLAAAVSMWGRRSPAGAPLNLEPGRERGMAQTVVAAVAVTAVILVGLTLLSFFSNRTLAGIAGEDPLRVRINGRQWWWEIRYEDPQPSKIVTTANELHIPVGEPVRLMLVSNDVIHSFWVPSLAGKLDLVPGQQNVLDLRADKPGVYRGQCAEFCGVQHAHMGIIVIAETRAEFDAWLQTQLTPAREPQGDEQRKGRDLFMNRPCVMCHKIAGTTAGGTVAPDLTHLASRTSLAADTLKMSRGNLAAWIIDPQGIKPGAHMPVMDLDGDELNAVVAYLESLR